MIKLWIVLLFSFPCAFASSLLVQVELTSGQKITGIAREGKVAEKYVANEYVTATSRERGAGIRVWNIGGGSGYNFYLYYKVASLKTKPISSDVIRLAKKEALGMLTTQQQQLLIRFPPEEGWSLQLYQKNKPRIARNKRKGSPFRGISKEYVHFDYKFKEWWLAFQTYQAKTYQLIWQKLNKTGVIAKFQKTS